MSWNDLSPDVVRLVWDARRRAMARDLCERKERSVRATSLQQRCFVERWCDRRVCGDRGHHPRWAPGLWGARGRGRELAVCQVCRKQVATDSERISATPGCFCGFECYAFV